MKYELTDETKKAGFTTLHRIKALKDFGNVKAGELGGYLARFWEHLGDVFSYLGRGLAKMGENQKNDDSSSLLKVF